MTSSALTQAGQISRDLLAIRGKVARLEALASVLSMLESAADDTDAAGPLAEAVLNLRAEAQIWREYDADASVTARRFTGRSYHPVTAALVTVPESMRGPEWEIASEHFKELRARGVL